MLGQKLIFTGTVGAGKTTAIQVISEIPPVVTEVPYYSARLEEKTTTTVAMDYGEVTLHDGEKLLLYGTPGQSRFDFMWDILTEGALGVVVLIDNSRTDPIHDMLSYLDAFPKFVEQGSLVIGVGRSDAHPQPSISKFAHALSKRALRLPIFAVDVRRKDHVLLLLRSMLSMLEARVC
jgi:uncharacterized protein